MIKPIGHLKQLPTTSTPLATASKPLATSSTPLATAIKPLPAEMGGVVGIITWIISSIKKAK